MNSMFVGVAQFEIRMPFNRSLKEKRQILRKIKERVASKFKINLSEVGYLDKWQRAKIGFSLVGNDSQIIDRLITQTMNFVISMGLGEISGEYRDLLSYE